MFRGEYIQRGLSEEGNLRFKIDWASLIVGSIYRFCFVFLSIWGQFSKYRPLWAYIWRGDLTEYFLRY